MVEDVPLIETMQISNFRSIREVVIPDVPRIMGIWGPNGVGKSNLLQAIYFYHQDLNASRQRDNCLKLFHISSPLEIFNKHITDRSSHSALLLNRGLESQVTRKYTQNYEYSVSGQLFRRAIYLPPWRHVLDKNSNLQHGTTFEYTIDGNIVQNIIHEKVSRLASQAVDGDTHAKETLNILKNWSAAVGLGRISSRLETINTTTTYLDDIDGEMDVPDAGFGGRCALPIIALCTLTENELILIEEPEISLHPRAQSSMAKWLIKIAQRQNHQIFFTSHSEFLAKEFAKMLIEGEIDSNTFKPMLCQKDKTEGSKFDYIEFRDLMLRYLDGESLLNFMDELH